LLQVIKGELEVKHITNCGKHPDPLRSLAKGIENARGRQARFSTTSGINPEIAV
jgi:hypothetical protein